MFLKVSSILFIIFCWVTIEQKCQRNKFEFVSTYALGRQQDLTNTFKIIEKQISIQEVTYKDQVFRTYRIFDFKPALYFAQSKQKAEVKPLNILRISGGTLKLTYNFQWQKKQLSQSILGTASGTVTSDPISFDKMLQANSTHDLVWELYRVIPLAISNSLTISKISPYKASDSEIINQMLNSLKTNDTTVKIRLIQALNKDLEPILRNIVKNDPTWNTQKIIDYSYTDYRGQFAVSYDNVLQNVALKTEGLSLFFSQSLQKDTQFQCGTPVPKQPNDVKIFGGHQQFISNSLLKSTLRYALERGHLDIILTNDNWQSRAFQFYMGDVHDVILSTKNISTFLQVKGRCNALNDSFFNFTRKDNQNYEINVNFACNINYTNIRLLNMSILVTYTVKPILYPRYLDFVVIQIQGIPEFIEEEKYKIGNKQLALFMVSQIINTVKNSKILGSGYRISTRKYPNVWVTNDWLFLYDSSIKPKLDQQ